MSLYGERCPVVVVAGFLGSGKTSLLNRVLKDPALGDCAVLVNEFGEVGLDHHLLEVIDGNTVLLASGCVCCTIRDDLKSAVLELQDKGARGAVPAFSRLVIETTGLADPTPIIATFMSDQSLRYHYRPTLVVTTVDAVLGLATLGARQESVKQVALADRLVVSKTDLASPAALDDTLNVAELLRVDVYTPGHRETEVARWFSTASHHGHGHGGDDSRHDSDIHTFGMVMEDALDWTAFGVWLTMLLHCHGD